MTLPPNIIPTGLLCIDAASSRSGVALFSARGRVVAAKAADMKDTNADSYNGGGPFGVALARAERMGREIAVVAASITNILPGVCWPRRIIIEYPRIYKEGPMANLPGDDLLVLAAAAMAAWVNLAALYPQASIEPLRPQDWKHQVKKKIMLERILDRLDPDELAQITDKKNDNVIDAVGIGLHACVNVRL